MASVETDFEKWLWVELTGFDNTLPDFGASDFLGRMEDGDLAAGVDPVAV
ncbi:MAG: hypothetical protein WCT05_14630 [Lentisphaeria bacterium]